MKREMWVPDRSALSLLDTLGGPFSTSAFREAMVAVLPEWHDMSIGARDADGTLAAVSLLGRRRGAESVPPAGYGGVVASRPLEPAETLSFLEFVIREHRLRRCEVRTLQLIGESAVGQRFATASVIPVLKEEPPASRYARLARRSVSRATAAGATVHASEPFAAFWPAYAAASKGRAVHYPELLVRRLVEDGSARVHTVRLETEVVAALLTLVIGTHWMCWLAGQNNEGRSIAASYLAYDAVLADAWKAGIVAVNLGASVGGGGEFKRHLGAMEMAMYEWKHMTAAVATTERLRRVAGAGVSVMRNAQARLR
jgi:Acetyltransferase (GNAT) domain